MVNPGLGFWPPPPPDEIPAPASEGLHSPQSPEKGEREREGGRERATERGEGGRESIAAAAVAAAIVGCCSSFEGGERKDVGWGEGGKREYIDLSSSSSFLGTLQRKIEMEGRREGGVVAPSPTPLFDICASTIYRFFSAPDG